MSVTNDFLQFCATTTGTNLPTQSAYAADPNRAIGNQPGIASSKFNNKPLRQATYIISQLAQYVSDFANVSVLDDDLPLKLLAQMNATFKPLAPIVTQYLSGSGTWNATYQFFILSGSATAGATYTNNSVTFTVVSTVASGVLIKMTGNGDPTTDGGTLTKASGTGDATLTFFAFRKALRLELLVVGGGGGGGAQYNVGGGPGSDGGDTTFGTALIVGGHGFGGGVTDENSGPGGSASLGSGPIGFAFAGAAGENSVPLSDGNGANGGSTPFGGRGLGGQPSSIPSGVPTGGNAVANTGSGGGGAASSGAGPGGNGAGGAGGYVNCFIFSPLSSYAYVIGAGGAGGTAGAGVVGGNGASGVIRVIEHYQ